MESVCFLIFEWKVIVEGFFSFRRAVCVGSFNGFNLLGFYVSGSGGGSRWRN